MKIQQLLDAVKNANGLKTDGELARKLGVDKRRVSDYYKGDRVPDEFVCLKISENLGISLASVIAQVKAETEKDETRREAWRNYMKSLGGLAAGIALGFFVLVTSIVTPTPQQPLSLAAQGSGTICIMLSIGLALALSQIKPVLRRIGQKCTFGVYVARVRQIAT